MSDLEDRFRAAGRACADTVVGHTRRTPGEVLADLGRACDELGLDTGDGWDTYGEGGAVERLESEVAELLGKPAAVFFVSGVMAQQAALRVWCERRGSMRVALPDLAHLLKHEADGPRVLQGFRFEHLTEGRCTPTAADLRELPGPSGLGVVHVELPLREAGCALPTWTELSQLSGCARELGVPLHLDGARLWESRPFYDRTLSEITALADSVYVSFYKGLAALAGAALVGDEDVVDEARVWRQRMGGQLYRLTPYAVSALVGLREHLPLMGEYAAWARSLSVELTGRGIRVTPDPPHTNTFRAYAPGDPDEITERALGFMAREGVQPCAQWWQSEVPGTVVTEVTGYSPALRHDPAVVAGWYAEVLGL